MVCRVSSLLKMYIRKPKFSTSVSVTLNRCIRMPNHFPTKYRRFLARNLRIFLTVVGSCDTTVPTFDKFRIANSHDCWDVAILIFPQQSYLHFARAICTCTLRQPSVDITVYLFRADLELRISVQLSPFIPRDALVGWSNWWLNSQVLTGCSTRRVQLGIV